MISNPNLVFYFCIAKGSVILAEFSSKEPGIETGIEPGIETVAAKCIQNTPPHHSMFSHTVCKRTYMFLIDDPFVYFGIFDETIDKSEPSWLLNRLKCHMNDLIKKKSIGSIDNPTPRCLQTKFEPVFAEIMDLNIDLDSDVLGSPRSSLNPSLDLSKGRRSSVSPLLGKPLKMLKKKKRSHMETNGEDVSKDSEKRLDFVADETNGMLCKELSNGSFHGVDHHRQKAKQTWRKHVWVVLIFDLFICAILFGIWLWICKGFQCIDG